MKKYHIISFILFLLIVSCENDSIYIDYGDWPYTDNTGLTDPYNLTTVGDTIITTSGATVENLNVIGQLTIQANNVTIKNCRIWGGMFYGVVVMSGYSGNVIEDCDIGKNYTNSSKGILINTEENTEITIRKCHIHHVGDGIFGGGGNDIALNCKLTVQDCYISNIRETDGDDNVETIDDHKGDGMEFLGQIREALIQHNSIYVPSDQTSCILFQSNWGNLRNITIEDNLLLGGGYTLYTRINAGRTFEGLTIINNHFGRNYHYGIWSNDVDTTEITAYGNVWHDTGEPVEGILGTEE